MVRFGLRLRRGDVVTTGVATDVFEASAGQSFVADFGPVRQSQRSVRLTTTSKARGYENDWPQPQVRLALGLVMANPLCSRPSL
jgi:hypothetical protein